MKYHVDNKHREFYQRHGWIEFEKIATLKQVDAINLALKTINREGLHTGRDLWRYNADIRTVTTSRNLANIAAELISERPLRLAFDQQLEIPGAFWFDKNAESLLALSSIQPIKIALLLLLDSDEFPAADPDPRRIELSPPQIDEAESLITPEEKKVLLPSKPRNGVFFSPQAALKLSLTKPAIPASYLLIAYCSVSARYILNPCDPDTHWLKNFAYGSGDLINTYHHPLLAK